MEILNCLKNQQYDSFVKILWRICSMQELLSHRGLGACSQHENCGLYWHVARRQLCEHLDCTTGSASDVTCPTHPVTMQRSVNNPPHQAVTSCNRGICAETIARQLVNTMSHNSGSYHVTVFCDVSAKLHNEENSSVLNHTDDQLADSP